MSHTDIKKESWIFSLPAFLRPYAMLARLDRPIGTWLLLLPGWWSILLACGGIKLISPEILLYMVLFAAGAVIMRGAGCTVNDLWDRDFDSKVERTKTRPLASSAITPLKAALFVAVLSALGLLILLQFSLVTVMLGILSLPFIIVYPLMKRWTWWPQAFLGLTFNFGALMGWSAVNGVVSLPSLLLYAGGFFWTLGYDTIYACQDIEDDSLAGIKSTARLFGDKSKVWVSGFYAASLLLIIVSGIYAHAGYMFFVVMGAAGLHLFLQVKNWNPQDPAGCLKTFKSNRDFGLIVTLAAALSGIYSASI